MSLTTRYDEETGVFWVVLAGDVELGDVLGALEDISSAGHQRRIWDVRDATELPPNEILDFARRLREAPPPGPGRSAVLTGPGRTSNVRSALGSHPDRAEVRFAVFDDTEEAVAWVAARPPAPKGETIVVAEDQELVRDLLSSALKRAGYRVVTASDGQSGWERINELEESGSTVDLVVADVVMPALSGVELAERVLAAYPHTQVIFISGYQDREPPAGSAFLKKPFGYDDLLEEVRDVLAKRKES